MTENKSNPIPAGDPSLFLAPMTLRNCALAWFIPGLGYFLTGRKRTGIIVCVSLYTAYFFGAILGGDLYDFSWVSEGKIRYFGAICQAGMGLPYLIAKLGLERGTPLNLTYDYGTSYFLISGMINWLITLDIFDISVKRK